MVRKSCKEHKIRYCKCNKCLQCEDCTCEVPVIRRPRGRPKIEPKETVIRKKRGPSTTKRVTPVPSQVPSRRSKRTRLQKSVSYSDALKDSELDSPNDSTSSDCNPVNETLSDLGFSEEYATRMKKQIGSAESRATDTNLPSTNHDVYNALTKALVDCTSKVAKVFFPANPEQLQKTAAEATLSNLEKSKKKEAKLPIATRKRHFDETRNKISGFISNLTNGSIAKRTANALIQACLPDEGIICESRARKKAKEDIKILEKSGSLEQTHHSRKKVSDEVVEFAVSFILSDYVQRLSWDTKKIRLCSNETIELPKIIRCIGLEDLYVVYKSTCEEQHKTPLGKTKFRELAGKITSGGQTKAISCVNYVDGNLVNDNCERLQMIVDAIFEKSSAKHKFYTEHISHMKNFLKTQFDSHLHHNDGDAFHSLTHALCKPCRHDTTKCDHGEHSCSICIHPENKFECNGCKFPYWLLAQLYDEVNKVSLRNDSSERGNLASQNQQESILVEDVTEEDEEDESSNDSSSSSSSPLLHTDENDSVPKSDSSERGNLERPNRQESILVEEVMEEDEEDESSNDSSRILGDADENDSVPDLPHLRLDDEDERNEI